MKRIFNKVMFFCGVILFIIGWGSVDNGSFLISLMLTFGGLGIAYLNRGVLDEYYREYDEEL